jgi:hypothetical protein
MYDSSSTRVEDEYEVEALTQARREFVNMTRKSEKIPKPGLLGLGGERCIGVIDDIGGVRPSLRQQCQGGGQWGCGAGIG